MQKRQSTQKVIEQQLLIIPTDGSTPSVATLQQVDHSAETVQQDPYDDIYGPLVALGPYIVDHCPLPPQNRK